MGGGGIGGGWRVEEGEGGGPPQPCLRIYPFYSLYIPFYFQKVWK